MIKFTLHFYESDYDGGQRVCIKVTRPDGSDRFPVWFDEPDTPESRSRLQSICDDLSESVASY